MEIAADNGNFNDAAGTIAILGACDMQYFIWLFILLTATLASSATRSVNSSSDFQSAINSADPGDVIEIQDGTHTNWGLVTIGSEDTGAQDNEITITAETKGGVVFDGADALRLVVQGNHWVI